MSPGKMFKLNFCPNGKEIIYNHLTVFNTVFWELSSGIIRFSIETAWKKCWFFMSKNPIQNQPCSQGVFTTFRYLDDVVKNGPGILGQNTHYIWVFWITTARWYMRLDKLNKSFISYENKLWEIETD